MQAVPGAGHCILRHLHLSVSAIQSEGKAGNVPFYWIHQIVEMHQGRRMLTLQADHGRVHRYYTALVQT